MIFKGSGVALITPFDKNNKINFNKVSELIEFHISKNTDAIIVCGTTGESSTLSNDEKKELIKFSVEIAKNRIPIIAGTGSNNTKIAVEMSEYAQKVGSDGLLIVTPYYNKCSEKSIYLHYKEISKHVSIPIILYNVPSRTCVDISINNIIKLSKINNICGIKEANTDLSKIASIINSVEKDFYVYSGNDDLLLPTLSLGGMGVISVAANIIPNEMHNICDYFFNNNYEKSKELYYQYFSLFKKLFVEVNPSPIKFALNELGFNVGNLRLPLSSLTKNSSTILKNELLNCIK